MTANGRVLSCLGATGATWLDLASPLPRDYGAHRSHGDPRFVGQLFSLTGFPGGLVVKNPSASAEGAEESDLIPGSGRSLEEKMATHSSVLAWRIPGTEGPGKL